MEVSHRSRAFIEVRRRRSAICASFSALANYRVLFMQGGASAQFAAIPLNLARRGPRRFSRHRRMVEKGAR
jgi:phosphoserine aminotransferase